MELKNIFKMTKTDRYTQDGRDELAKLQETEDVTYKTGDISQKTGLQKQPDGSWAPPKETKYGKVQQNKEGKWGVQQKLGKGSQFLEHKNEKDASKALANYTAGYNTTERSKQDPHSNEARQAKQWNKETEKIAKENKTERRAEHAAQFQKTESKPGRDYPILKKEDHVSLANEVKSNTMPGSDWTAEEIAKEWKLGKADAEEVKKEFDKIKTGSNNLKWNEMPNGRVWTSRTDAGKPLTVTWNREKNGDVWYGRSDSETKYKSKEEAMNAPVNEPDWMKKIGKEFKDVIAKNPKLQQYLNRGSTSQLTVPGEGTYLGEAAVARHRELSKENNANERQGGKAKDYKLQSVELDEQTARDLISNYSEDAAPKIRNLTGDCKIKIRK